jgi:hypothetical protein
MFDTLVNIEQGPEWLEWSAALYESYAADFEPNASYARTAERQAESLERSVYESNPANDEFVWRLRQCDWK